MYDTIIYGGSVFDGLGNETIQADLAIKGDTIATIGNLQDAEAAERIDATECIVCPGFIDTHSHSDAYLLIEPDAPSKLFQGVTTEVVGQCGASCAPLHLPYQMPSDWREQKYPGTWSSVAEYRELLESVKPGPNVVLMIGYNTLRAGVSGYSKQRLDGQDRKQIRERFRQALEEGARGLTTGMIYPPGQFASKEEIIDCAAVAAEFDGIYASHMRSERAGLIESIDETIRCGLQAGLRVQISHLKAAGPENWPLIERAFERIEKARDAGEPVAADRYPYTAACTDLDIVFPDWAFENGPEGERAILASADGRQRLREGLLREKNPKYWQSVMIGSTGTREFRGLRLPEIADQLNLDPIDALIELVRRDDMKTGGIFFGMSEENMWKVLEKPYVMIGSDGSLRSPSGPLSHDHPHPRTYGSFARFLRASLDGQTVALTEAIRKMTSLPAEQFGLAQRGQLKEGFHADIVVFSPDQLKDRSTYGQPHQLAEGIKHVWVNGTHTLADSKASHNRNGRLLHT